MEIHDAYKQKMAAQMKEWSAQINLLEAKLDNVGAEMRVRREEEKKEVRGKKHAAVEKMKEWGKKKGADWEEATVEEEKRGEEDKRGRREE